MQLNTTYQNPTLAMLEITASSEELNSIKNKVLKSLSSEIKVPGFRAGHVPSEVVEKNIDSNRLQSVFLDEAINLLYQAAVKKEKLRPVDQPKVSIKAFVPFTQLELDFEVPTVGPLKLGDYKKHKAKLLEAKVSDKEIQTVLDNLAIRASDYKLVERKSQQGDRVWIDFVGKDSKGNPIERADGKDYPLILGSKTFIPGFEENLSGFKAGDKTNFTVTFPKNYGQADLQNKKVTFEVSLNKVEEVIKPDFNDEFAKKMGPFKSIEQLKADVQAQLQFEKDEASRRDYEAAVIKEISEKSSVELPQIIIDKQAEEMLGQFKRDLAAQGQTWPEFVKNLSKTEDEYLEEVIKPAAAERIKAGLVLSAIAEAEKLTVSESELDKRIMALKKQYSDAEMVKQLDKPENQQDIAARILSEKTIAFLTRKIN